MPYATALNFLRFLDDVWVRWCSRIGLELINDVTARPVEPLATAHADTATKDELDTIHRLAPIVDAAAKLAKLEAKIDACYLRPRTAFGPVAHVYASIWAWTCVLVLSGIKTGPLARMPPSWARATLGLVRRRFT